LNPRSADQRALPTSGCVGVRQPPGETGRRAELAHAGCAVAAPLCSGGAATCRCWWRAEAW